MARYFKVVEIDESEFKNETSEELDCSQIVVPVNGIVYVAVDEYDEGELQIPLDCFE